jgi:deazaflavin-dependent oxidoreductase (nitroreductase family)
MKHRIVHGLQKYVFNPPVKALLAAGFVPPSYALLETVGRTSGMPRTTPVGNGLIGDTFWIVTEHGLTAGYVRNLQRNPSVRVKSGTTAFAPGGVAAARIWLPMTTPASARGRSRTASPDVRSMPSWYARWGRAC